MTWSLRMVLASALLASVTGVATAGDPAAGDLQIKVGVTGVIWDNNNHGVAANGSFISGASGSVDNVVIPTAQLNYYFSHNISAELFCCFAHADVKAGGSLTGAPYLQDKLSDTWTFPPIVTLQYHFDGLGAFRPYVGAGVEWIHYFDSKSDASGVLAGYNSVKFSDSFGPALQAGFDVDLGGNWSLGFDVKKVWESTKITWTDGKGDNIITKHDLDPLFLTANIGYRFNLDALLGRSAPAPLK